MKEMIIREWIEFEEVISNHNYREWLYRGQSDSTWELKSSLFRVFQKNIELRSLNKSRKIVLKKELYEKEIIDSFKRSAHLYLDAMPDKNIDFDWLSLMQHYGAPTRLLDFSFSPWVALFFAISEIKENASIFCIKYKEISKIDAEYYKDVNVKYDNIMKETRDIKNTILLPYEPVFTNNRLMAQQGAFLIPNTLNYSHQEILENYQNDDFVIKITINKNHAMSILESLAKMNITFMSVYPGLEGFCRSFESVGLIPINRLRPINRKEDV